jgi:hypothetical protein
MQPRLPVTASLNSHFLDSTAFELPDARAAAPSLLEAMPISPAVRYDRGSPEIVIVNKSRDVDDKRLARVTAALQTQIDRDFFPLWGWRAKLVLNPKRARPLAMKIELTEIPDEDDALGYHFIDGLPSTYVFTRDLKGEPAFDFESTLSHEILEMIADPGVNLYAQGFIEVPSASY